MDKVLIEKFKRIIIKSGYSLSTHFVLPDVVYFMRRAWVSGRLSSSVPIEALAAEEGQDAATYDGGISPEQPMRKVSGRGGDAV